MEGESMNYEHNTTVLFEAGVQKIPSFNQCGPLVGTQHLLDLMAKTMFSSAEH